MLRPRLVTPAGSIERTVWRIPRAGSLRRLAQERERLPEPGPGEARVAVRAVGLNFADLFACLGLYSATPPGAFVPGLELAGLVEALGPAGAAPISAEIAPGARVMGLTRFGAYATAVNLDLRYLRPIPAAWSFAEAAAFPVQALTAWYAVVEVGRAGPGEVALVQSAAGGVGLNALALLSARGARIVAVVGRAGKRDFLVAARGLMAGEVVLRDRRRFGKQLDEALAALGAEGFDLVLDAVCGPFFRPAYRRVSPQGRYVLFGAASFMPRGARPAYLRAALTYLRRPRLDPLAMIAENRSVTGFNLIWLWDRVERLGPMWDACAAALPAPPLIGRRVPFDAAPVALRHLQSGDSIGKIVLEVESPG